MKQKALMQQPVRGLEQKELRKLLQKFLEESGEDSWDWESITKANGLSHNWIYDLFEDSRGRIWVGTWGGGVCLFDGSNWKSFDTGDGLLSAAATCIREDQDGRIWIATDNGLNVFSNEKIQEAGLAGKSLLSLVIDKRGHLWAGCWRRAGISGGCLFEFNGKTWKSYTPESGLPGLEILKVFEDSKGNIWVGTYEQGWGAGVGCYNGQNWQVFNQTNGLINNCVYSMFEDPQGNMWFGTVGGISIYDGKQWHRITSMDGLIDDRVYAMLIDSNHKMWFGTENGVSLFDGKKWKSFTKEDGLVQDLVRTIIEDRNGNIWFGTYPYTPGLGGISIAKRKDDQKKVTDQILNSLPSRWQVKSLAPGKKQKD